MPDHRRHGQTDVQTLKALRISQRDQELMRELQAWGGWRYESDAWRWLVRACVPGVISGAAGLTPDAVDAAPRTQQCGTDLEGGPSRT